MIWLSFILWIWLMANRLVTAQSLHDSQDDPRNIGVPTLLLGSLHLTLSTKLLLDIHSPRAQLLKGYLGWLPRNSNLSYTSCTGDDSPAESICLRYGKHMKLLVTQENGDNCEKDTMTCHAVECHTIHWTNHIGGAMDCFILGEDDWYGGGEMIHQRWPIQDDIRSWYPAATGDPLHHTTGNVIENLWLSSSGFAIYVEHDVPLFVSFNESGSGKMCFSTSSKKHPYDMEFEDRQNLTYHICSAASIKEAHLYSLHKWIDTPQDIPDETMFHYPVWSTWARYKRHINQSVVMEFASEIESMDFPISHLQIDDMWESCYGDLEFDLEKFPNPGEMVNDLMSKEIPTTLWVTPFCNVKCNCYRFGKDNNLFVKDVKGEVLEMTWWNGEAAVLDTTNEEAAEWFVKRLRMLQSEYGISSFKFDAGEVLWMSENFVLHDPKANLQPNLYSKTYAEIASKFGERVEVRVGFGSQNLPVFVRMFDKFSRWDYENGLKTLIPNALQLSLMGYFFILPDMIGGNNYDSLNGSLPDRELYIRWLQASVFLPVIQFSIVPWDYDEEVVNIAKKMVVLHESHANYMLKAAMEATASGKPIIRPLWWIAPDDTDALKTDSQFLVGDELMVAPVLAKGKKRRNIYLPEGHWRDVQRGKIHEGPQWLYGYEAPLNFLPFFLRLT